MDIDTIITDYNKPVVDKKKYEYISIGIRLMSMFIILYIVFHYLIVGDYEVLCKHKPIIFISLLVVFDIMIDTFNC